MNRLLLQPNITFNHRNLVISKALEFVSLELNNLLPLIYYTLAFYLHFVIIS